VLAKIHMVAIAVKCFQSHASIANHMQARYPKHTAASMHIYLRNHGYAHAPVPNKRVG
jgi:hypothetical protein